MAPSVAPAMAVMSVLIIVLSLATSAQAGSHLRPPKGTITGITFTGTACSPADTEVVYSHNDNTLTTILGRITEFHSEGLSGKRRNCLISCSLDYPTGWQVTIEKVTASFFAELFRGSKFGYEVEYHFSPSSGPTGIPKPIVRRIIRGRKQDNLEFTDHFLPLVYSQCKRNPDLNIKTVARLSNGQTSVTNFKLTLHLIWKEC